MAQLAHTMVVWEDVLATLRRMSVSWRGSPLSERDLHTYTEAIVMCALHLTDLSLWHGGIGSERELVAWAKAICRVDVADFGSFLSDAVTLLRNATAGSSYSLFKRRLARDYPFTGIALAPIRTALEIFFECPSASGFYPCYQFLSFLTHLSLEDLAIDLEGEYEELEHRLQSWSYPSSILKEMNEIMQEWLRGFRLTEEAYHPKHGPGATAETKAVAAQVEKYQYLGTDALLTYVLTKHVGVDPESYYPYPSASWERTSKVVFVPKSIKTRRTISKEPATLMYHQQAVASHMKKFMRDHAFLSKHIDLEDQSPNAELALRGSADQKFATIDLSSASDCVTVKLVKAVFRGTALYPFLVALRSNIAEMPSGKRIETAKFAPMGSALCFPIETLIFACAVEYAVRRARRTHLGSFPVWRVYGDDIIVADEIFLDVQLVLEALGFILNDSKSFQSPSRFRESCGAHGYDGVDVTPLKISRRFAAYGKWNASHHAALWSGRIDMANSAYVYSFSLLRAWVVRSLLDDPVGVPLFSGSPDRGLVSLWPDNYRAPSRLNWDRRDVSISEVRSPSYQRREIQVAQSRSLVIEHPNARSLEQARYFETLRLSENRTGDMFSPEHRIEVLSGTRKTVLRRTWVERPALR